MSEKTEIIVQRAADSILYNQLLLLAQVSKDCDDDLALCEISKAMSELTAVMKTESDFDTILEGEVPKLEKYPKPELSQNTVWSGEEFPEGGKRGDVWFHPRHTLQFR